MENSSKPIAKVQTDQFAKDVCQTLILGSLGFFMASLLEILGQHLIVLSDTAVLKYGSALRKIPIWIIFGVLIVAAGLALWIQRMSLRRQLRITSWYLAGLVVTALIVLFRVLAESSGFLGVEPKLSTLLPDFRFLGWITITLMIVLGIATTFRLRFCESTWRIPWRLAAGSTIFCTYWYLSSSMMPFNFKYLLLISLAIFLITVCYADGFQNLLRGLLGEDDYLPAGLSRPVLGTAFAICFLSVAHGVSGFFYPIPAWKMFRYIERWSYELEDASGEKVVIRDHIPARAYSVAEHGSVFVVAKWLAEKEPERNPLIATIRQMEVRGGEESSRTERFIIAFDSNTGKASVELMRDSKQLAPSPIVTEQE